MRLKSLEIKGFKSFSEKTVINFSEDVIGIVGSNGCGKSNIVDSIRWVLGEQKTKQLRSDSMTSVIFNGTSKRKAAALAEVSLRFENDRGVLPTEFQEVTIKRALHKDGSGEYYLNGVKCRLKDINNLLSDTGMGSDSYAIIALGMVDDLLQDKDNSRLKLFEQAAGISKYKIRKKETLRKLKQTAEDLERVEDLLHEVEQQLKTLERQAKRAKRYLELKAEYKQLSIDLQAIRIRGLRKDYSELEKKMAQEQQQIQTQQGEQEVEQERLRSAKREQLEKEQRLSAAQQKLNQLIGRIKGLENEQKMKAQEALFLQQNKEKLLDRLRSGKERLAAAQQNADRYAQQKKTEEEVQEILSDALYEAQEQLAKIRSEHGQLKIEVEQFLEEQKSMQERLVQAEKEMAVYETEQNNLKKQYRQIDERLALRAEELKAVELAYRESASELQTQKGILEGLQQAEEIRKNELESVEQQLESESQLLQQKNRLLDAKSNEKKLLEDLVKSMEGYAQSVKFLHQNDSWTDKPTLLSDLFYCPEEYRLAVENYLSPYLNYYLVQTAEEAYRAVQLLEAAEKGKANFFILDWMVLKDEKQLSVPGARAVLELVDYEADYEALAQQLFAQVYILEEGQERPAQSAGHFLSKDGKRSFGPYSLKGGSVGAFEGKKIGRKKNLALLAEEIELLQTEVGQLQQAVDELRLRQKQLRQADRSREIQTAERGHQQLLQKHISLEGKLEGFEQFKAETKSQKEQLRTELKKIRNDKREIEGELEFQKDQLEQLQRRLGKKNMAFKEQTQELSQASSQYNKKHIEQLRQQNRLEGLDKEWQFAQRQAQELQQQLKQDQKALEEGEKKEQSLLLAQEDSQKQLQEFYEDRQLYKARLSDVEQQFFSGRGEIRNLEEHWEEGQKQLQKSQELFQLQKERFAELKMQLSTIAERLHIEFELQLSQLLAHEVQSELPKKELDQKVEQLRLRINNYGAVNEMAIEAFDEAKERFDFIGEQRQDLIEAKDSLMQTIEEIDDTASKKFMEAFEQAREHFIRVFRSLFLEDDTCDLLLSDPQNPLESRIEIIAKPKGKRPLSINQLSGGEKTLTATALLFSLYLLKPAPFCIFDEVDAPLDDTNIAKFNNIIKDFSANSQFIIVTHNKKTMAAVDVMYGVSMQQGISRVIPVDFRMLQPQ